MIEIILLAILITLLGGWAVIGIIIAALFVLFVIYHVIVELIDMGKELFSKNKYGVFVFIGGSIGIIALLML